MNLNSRSARPRAIRAAWRKRRRNRCRRWHGELEARARAWWRPLGDRSSAPRPAPGWLGSRANRSGRLVRVIDIDAIAHNMVALDDDVAEIDADAVKHG